MKKWWLMYEMSNEKENETVHCDLQVATARLHNLGRAKAGE